MTRKREKADIGVVMALVSRSSDMGETWREIAPACKVRAVVIVTRPSAEIHLAVEAATEQPPGLDPRTDVVSATLVKTMSAGSEVQNGLAGSEFMAMLRADERAALEARILDAVAMARWETGAIKVVGDTAYELTPMLIEGAKAWFSGTPYRCGMARDGDERSEWEEGHVLASSGDLTKAEVDAAAELLLNAEVR